VSIGLVGVGIRFFVVFKGMGLKGEMVMMILEYDWLYWFCIRVDLFVMIIVGIVIFDEVVGGMRLGWDW